MDNLSIAQANPKNQVVQTSKRSYTSHADYAAQHGAQPRAFTSYGWRETTHKERPALEYQTDTGPRWRYLDGQKPSHDSPPKYRACWYGLKRALAIATATGRTLILVNGAPSVVATQYYDQPTFALSAGESWDIPAALIDDLKAAGVTEIIIAGDCDDPGRRSAGKRARQFIEAGLIVRAVDLQLPDGGDFADFRKAHGQDTYSRLADLPEIAPAEPERPRIIYERAGGDRRDEYISTVVIPAIERAATGGRGKHFNCINPDHHDEHPSARIGKGRDGQPLYHCTCGHYSLFTVAHWLGLDYKTWLRETYPQETRRKAKKPAPPIRQRDIATPAATSDALPVQYVADDLTPAAIAAARTLLIAAPVGTGKTRTVANYANGLPEGETITGIAQFRLLTSALNQALKDSHHYEDAPANRQKALGHVARLVTSASSLYKFNRQGGRWIVDEFEGVLEFIASSDTFRRGEALAAYRALKQGIQSASQVIGMDANLSDITINWLERVRGDVTVKRYRASKQRGKVTFLRGRTEAFYTVGKLLEKRKGPVYLACSAEADATDAADYFSPHYRVLKITRDTSNTATVQAFIKNANGERAGYDLVIYTSAMGAGVDIAEPVYGLVGLFHRTPLAPEHALQLYGRVRNASRRYATVPSYSDGYKTPSAAELLADKIRREVWTSNRTGQDAHISGDYLETAQLWAQFTERRLRETAQWRVHFARRLKDNGYTVAANNASAPQSFADALTIWRQERKDSDAAAILATVDPLPNEHLDTLRMRGVEITRELKLRNVRFRIEGALGHADMTDTDTDLIVPRGRRRLYRLSDLFADVGELLASDRAQADEGRPLQKRQYRALNQGVLSKLLALVNITGAPETAFTAFTDYFRQERSAPDVCERFAALATPAALKLFEALGEDSHHGNNARSIPGLCRWLVKYFGLKLTSRQRRIETGRAMFYQLDSDVLAYRMERARRANALRTENLSKNVYIEAKSTFLDTPPPTPLCHKPPGEGWRERPVPKVEPHRRGDISHLPTFGGKSKFNPFSRPESELAA